MLIIAQERLLQHSLSISVYKNASYHEAFSASQVDMIVPKDCKLRRVKYLNNVIEQDHRFFKEEGASLAMLQELSHC
jgi:transposase-like protein